MEISIENMPKCCFIFNTHCNIKEQQPKVTSIEEKLDQQGEKGYRT